MVNPDDSAFHSPTKMRAGFRVAIFSIIPGHRTAMNPESKQTDFERSNFAAAVTFWSNLTLDTGSEGPLMPQQRRFEFSVWQSGRQWDRKSRVEALLTRIGHSRSLMPS